MEIQNSWNVKGLNISLNSVDIKLNETLENVN